MNHRKSNYPPPPPLTTITTSATSLSSSSSSKKKFGKNLNKLIKQPTPPPITGLNSRSLYRSNSGNNGTSNLVLLSTKKKKSSLDNGNNGVDGTNNANDDNGTTSGGGKNDMKVGGKSSNQTSTTGVNIKTSTKLKNSNIVFEDDDNHHIMTSSEMMHDKAAAIAWGGMSYKKKKDKGSTSAQQNSKRIPPIDNTVEVVSQPQPPRNNAYSGLMNDTDENISHQNIATDDDNNKDSDLSSTLRINQKIMKSNSHHQSTMEKEEKEEDQVEFMKKLAKEKAAKLRQEEENRIKEQKERAALRLKELEMKMARKGVGIGGNGANANSSVKRSLFDPTSSSSRSYSALVGNNNNSTNVTTTPSASQNHRDVPRQKQGQGQNQKPTQDQTTAGSTSLPPMSTIHLSSYDDRDRGMMRNVNAGPRMLFDPKSGSMVAVPPKDESSKNNHGSSDRDGKGGNSNNRNRKDKNKSKSLRKRDSDNVRGNEDSSDGKDNKANRRNKSKKDKKRDEKRGVSGGQERKRKNSTSSTTDKSAKCSSGKTNRPKKDRLPRTKGVLYKRDGNGKFVSVDGCEGDQGYGAHSVPGGRVRNPKAYASYQKQLQEEHEMLAFPYQDFNDTNAAQGYGAWHLQYSYHSGLSLPSELDAVPSKLNRSHFMKKKSPPEENLESKEDEIHNDVDLPSPFRVTGDDKLELLTGMDDSPTLQATAAEWAPSQAALDLAAANANKVVQTKIEAASSEDISETKENTFNVASLVVQHENNDDDDIEESKSIQYGLGFDPAKDMDAVIRTPTFSALVEDKNIESPKVPQLLFETSRPASKSTNPFATDILLNSSPWGGNFDTTEGLGSLANWDYSLTTEKKDGDDAMTPSRLNADGQSAQSFLSLSAFNSDKNTWGSGGLISGLTDTSFGSPSSKS